MAGYDFASNPSYVLEAWRDAQNVVCAVHRVSDNPLAMKLSLLKRAADLGHAGAQRGYPLELQKTRQVESDQETQRQMLNIFGQIVGGAMRR
jgi:hypothetical protein